jgi:Family of unknown function (DUF6516)
VLPKLDLAQITALLAVSTVIVSWQIVVADEAARRAVYRIRCQLLRPAYQLEIRLIQAEDELLYSYQLFSDIPLVRWDNAPHFPALPTFPHHMHDETGTVSSSPLSGDPPQDLPYILDQTAALLPRL